MEDRSLVALRDAPPPPLHAVQARVRYRRRLRLVAGTVGSTLLAASVLLVVGAIPVQGVRDRGLSRAPLVSLDAVAEGPAGHARPLTQGSAVEPEERVVFFVRSSEAGMAVLREQGAHGSTSVWPAQGQWSIESGEHTPGEHGPLSWRPDGGAGPYRYVIEVCPTNAPGEGHCGTASLDLVWTP